MLPELAVSPNLSGSNPKLVTGSRITFRSSSVLVRDLTAAFAPFQLTIEPGTILALLPPKPPPVMRAGLSELLFSQRHCSVSGHQPCPLVSDRMRRSRPTMRDLISPVSRPSCDQKDSRSSSQARAASSSSLGTIVGFFGISPGPLQRAGAVARDNPESPGTLCTHGS